jgi:hypothetical protein
MQDTVIKRKRTNDEEELTKKMKFIEESASTKTNELLEELKQKEALVIEQAKKLQVRNSIIYVCKFVKGTSNFYR